MPIFPLPTKVDTYSKNKGCAFGASRDGGRKHAGCDLVIAKGTEIYAVEDGTIIQGPYLFYRGTYAIEIKHPNFVARYCEVLAPEDGGVKLSGGSVTKGQLIAKVGKMYVDSMLHFEMYDGTASGQLTDKSNPPFMRRKDLIDPTSYLDSWEVKS